MVVSWFGVLLCWWYILYRGEGMGMVGWVVLCCGYVVYILLLCCGYINGVCVYVCNKYVILVVVVVVVVLVSI